MSEKAANLPPSLTPEVLVYQNRRLSRLVRDLRKCIKNTEVPADDSEELSSLYSIIEELKADKASLYGRIDRLVASNICAPQHETLKQEDPVLERKPQELQSPVVEHAAPVDLARSEDIDDLRGEIVRLKSIIAICKSIEAGSSKDMELFNISSDRNVWMQKCKRAELGLQTLRESVEQQMLEIRKIALSTEETYLTEMERMSEEIVRLQQETKKSQNLATEAEAKLKAASERLIDNQSQVRLDSISSSNPDVVAMRDKLQEVTTSLHRYRDQLRMKEEQCSRILTQHVHLQHQLTTVEQENTLLRGQSQTVQDLISTTKERLEGLEKQTASESVLVSNLESECKRETALRYKLVEDLTTANTKIAQLEDVHSKFNSIISELQGEYQTVLKELNDSKRQKIAEATNLSRQSSNLGSLMQMELDELRAKIKCSLCQTRNKSVTLVTCMHCFCRQCVDEKMLNARNRKCPLCMQRFSDAEVREVHFLKD
jgi:E3 ubiquitin-protein ligase BRE1